MTTISVELPDEVAGRVAPIAQYLPQLRSFALDLIGYPEGESTAVQRTYPVLAEALDFLSSAPASADIIAFKFSPAVQFHLERLLASHRERPLAPQERAELDSYQQINHLLILLKARARAASSLTN